MKAIVCVSRKWGIGKDNKLLFHIPSDMKSFKNKTTGKNATKPLIISLLNGSYC